MLISACVDRMLTACCVQETHQLYHPISNQCLDSDAEQKAVYMMPCDIGKASQIWQWEKVNRTLVGKEWSAK